jgi:hypothetical protein
MKYDFITTDQVKHKFGVKIDWAGDKLREFVNLKLLENKQITGSNMVEYRPVIDKKTGEPVIYQYYIECKKHEEELK